MRNKNDRMPWIPTWRFIFASAALWITLVLALPANAQNLVVQYDRAGNNATFFTANEAEANFIDATLAEAYRKRGPAFAAWVSAQRDTVPVYRFYNPVTLAHFFTADEAEKNALTATPAGRGWQYENVAFHVYRTPGEDRVPVGRMWDSNKSVHRYLVDPRFETLLPAPGVFVEGIAFYALKVGASNTPKSGNDAARFLTQSTFGIESAPQVVALERSGYDAWLSAQFALPQTSTMKYLRDVEARGERIEEQHPYEAVWQQILFGDDQLRARVTFALSQLTVISNVAPDQNNFALVSWWDMLGKNSFGNYRQLLEEVTLHPAMGYYLNMMGNQKEDPTSNRSPNENFAREVLQLFSIGVSQLNLDGTLKRDASGQPIPTYDQKVIEGFAKVFTGWHHGGNNTAEAQSFFSAKEAWTQPMEAWPAHHSAGAKTLFNGVTLPAAQSAEKDLRDALDQIANHPNVAPFISKRLIQALVTSNPSPAYVERVARIFNDSGSGTRGDLRAVLRAILLDAEARSPASADAAKYGKQREPVLRFTQLLRATGAKAANGRNSIWWLDSADDALGQSPLLAPSVFNFFSPNYSRAGAIAKAGLVAPEFQITTEAQVVGSTNYLHGVVFGGGAGYRDEGRLNLDFARFAALERTPAALVDALALLFTNAQLSDAARETIVQALEKQSADAGARTKTALALLLVTPDFVIQR